VLSRRRVLKAIGGSAAMAAVATWLGGCQGGSLPFVGGGKPTELIMGYGVDQLSTTGLDPQIHSGTAAESQLRNCYDCLVQISKDLKTVEPQLATEWKRINPTTMQFKLREGVRFHNGEELDAEAIKFSIERPINPNTKPRSSIFATYANILDRVDVVDKYTVNVVTKKPDPLLLRRMSGFNMTIIAPKWAAAGGSEKIKVEAQGTGAYRIVEWGGAGSDVVLEANDKYWSQPATVKRVRIKIIPEQATRSAALRSKDIHVTHALWPEDESQIAGSGSAVTKKVPSNRIPFYFMEVRKPPFDKKEVRQAINYGANIDGIIKNVLQGNGTRTAAITAPWHFGNGKQVKPYPYDPQKAKELLKQAGLADGFESNIWFIQGRYMKDKEVAESISQELAKVGIKLKPQLNDTTKNSQLDLAKQQDGLLFASWGNWMFDVDNVYFPLFHSSARDTANDGKGQSSRPFGDPGFDKMIEEARVELDEEKRQSLYDKAEAFFNDQAPVLFMYQLTDIYGIDKRIKWDPRSDEMVWYREMSWA
jgi:peptide/nickel transport system substrate-binding protein